MQVVRCQPFPLRPFQPFPSVTNTYTYHNQTMTSSFANIDNEIAKTPVAPTEIVPANSNTEVVADNFFSNEGLEGGDIGQVQVPWITVVHGVGDMSVKFTPGQLVLNGELVLKQPLKISVVRMKMFMLEDIPFNSPERGTRRAERFPDVATARAAGFVPKWESYDLDDKSVRTVVNCADMDILVEGAPDEQNYPLEFGGLPFLFARTRAKGKDFKLSAEKIKTTAVFNPKLPLCIFKWVWETARVKEGANWVWRHKLTSAGKNTPEFVEFARQLL